MKAAAAQLARELFDGLKKAGSEIGETVGQLNVQARSELANSLFHQSNAFVLYGPGQNPNLLNLGQDQQHEQGHQHEMSHER